MLSLSDTILMMCFWRHHFGMSSSLGLHGLALLRREQQLFHPCNLVWSHLWPEIPICLIEITLASPWYVRGKLNHRRAAHQECAGQKITCTSNESTGNLLLSMFLVSCYSALRLRIHTPGMFKALGSCQPVNHGGSINELTPLPWDVSRNF